jgi:hypothetical protein
MDRLLGFSVKIRRIILTTLLSISILSCGGEGAMMSAGISGTGIVLGVITGFGSIFVNGVEYDIDQASIDEDGITTSAQNNNLAIGMVVRLMVSNNGDGTGRAVSVVYDDIIEGPISSPPVVSTLDADVKQLSVLGHTIQINAASTTFYGNGLTFNNIKQGDVIEVNGFEDPAQHKIIATRVERKAGNGGGIRVEIHGVIKSLNQDNFTLNNYKVDISSITESDLSDLPNGLQDGLLVEVNGFYQSATASIDAFSIEGEDDDVEQLANASGVLHLEGLVSALNESGDFELNGIQVDTSLIDQSIKDQLKNGFQVQVRGVNLAGKLIADHLEIRTSEAEFQAVIESIDDIANNRIVIGYPGLNQPINLLFDQQSQLVEEVGHSSKSLALNELKVNWGVKVRVKKVGSDWVVVSLKHDHLSHYKIKGYITSKTSPDIVVINGLTLQLEASASYEVNDHDYDMSDFFDYIDTTDPAKSYVEFEDTNTTDDRAIFNEVELDPHHHH